MTNQTIANYIAAESTLKSSFLDIEESLLPEGRPSSAIIWPVSGSEALSGQRSGTGMTYFAKDLIDVWNSYFLNYAASHMSVNRKLFKILGEQKHFVLYLNNLNSAIGAVNPEFFNSLRSKYDSPDWSRVDSYLSSNGDLLPFLNDVSDSIKKVCLGADISLEYFKDHAEDWDKLHLVVLTRIDDPDEICNLEDQIFNELFDPNFDVVKGRIVLSLV